MILNDQEITSRITNQQLVINHEPTSVRNCGYSLRVGNVFLPESGEEFVFGGTSGALMRHVYTIEPAETVVVMTQEMLKMPDDLMASFWALNRRAMQGVLLINGSIVEPLYEGPLSCYLVNFSNRKIILRRGDPIGKLCFHKLTAPPATPVPQKVTSDNYKNSLSVIAQKYPKTFVGISTLKDEAQEAARAQVTASVKWGGGFIAVLLLWATIQPLVSSWIWDKTGYRKATEAQQRLDESIRFSGSPILEMRKEIDDLKSEVVKLMQTQTP